MKKRFLYSFATLLFSLLCAHLSFPQGPEEVLKKHMDALGGDENITNIKTLFARGKISMAGIEGRMKAWWSKPDKVRQEFFFPVFGPLIVSDGESFWIEDQNGGTRRLGEGKWMELLDQLFLENHQYLFSETRKEMGRTGMETSEDKPAHLIVDLISQEGGLTRVFIDDSSYLIDEYHIITSQESVTVRLSDYREVGGVMFPFRMHRTAGAPQSDTFVEFVEIVVNPPLPETLFIEPEAVGKDYRFVSGTGRIAVPFELVSNHIYFKAKVNDSPPLSFLLDTGAQLSYLDLSRADELKIRKTDRKEVRRVGACDDLSFFQLDSIKIGLTDVSSDGSGFAQNENLTLFNQIVAGISLSQVEEFDGKRPDGILGYDFLHRFVVEIDYLNRVLTLYETKNFKYTGDGEMIGIKMESYIPTIKAVVDGEYEGTFMIDTGSRNNLDLHASFVKTHRFLEEYPNCLETHVGFGITEHAKGVVGRIKSFQLGSFLINSPVTGFYLEDKYPSGFAKTAGKVGGGILRRFKVILDYPHYRVILEENADYHLWDRYNTSGLQLIQRGKKILVFHVIKDSPAQKAKIEEGDELLSVNHVPVSSCSLQRLRELLNQEEGTKIELKLKKKGNTEEVKLILKEMI